MTYRTVVLLACAFLFQPAWAITWGEVDTNNEFPEVGAIMWSIPSQGRLAQSCTGTLIHPRMVLTAAHCTVPARSALDSGFIDAVVVSFDVDISGSPLAYRVSRVVDTPLWNEIDHDFGILVLEEPVTHIAPATLPAEGFLDELSAQHVLKHGQVRAQYLAVGYGDTLDWQPPTPRTSGLRQFVRSEHRAVLNLYVNSSRNNAATGGGGACWGDSGGPLFYEESDGSLILVGISSWGDAQCVGVDFHHRVDILETLDYIEKILLELD